MVTQITSYGSLAERLAWDTLNSNCADALDWHCWWTSQTQLRHVLGCWDIAMIQESERISG
eukprot:1867754-Amphidinium_carterae.1